MTLVPEPSIQTLLDEIAALRRDNRRLTERIQKVEAANYAALLLAVVEAKAESWKAMARAFNRIADPSLPVREASHER